MKLIILDDYDQASEWAAKYIRNRIIHFNPTAEKYFTLGLPTGSTPLGCYKKLIEYHKNGDLSFKYVKTFNMDEYVVLLYPWINAYDVFLVTGLLHVHNKLVDPLYSMKEKGTGVGQTPKKPYSD
ncbi:glucosamine-6-phosphate deaminase 1-like [Anomaloglossus baeobatrachus]|uniref:glucosamine-6-phosphate deaminase 1-like n=1 Tax=Anomaloglossus baeobatrachus TaxID=238106 RepID=UPI003F503E36